jgi:mannosyltransferase OCH1-like enzyme
MTQREAGGELPIVQYWHNAGVPAEIGELIATFRDLNPDLPHMLFCESEAEEFIAEHYTSREVGAFRSCAVPAMQADYFRYCAILALGGIYVDADFQCLRPLQTLVDKADGGMLFRREPTQGIVNGLFIFKAPGHPLLKLALEVATGNIERRAAPEVYKVTGPWIFTVLWALNGPRRSELLRKVATDPEQNLMAESFIEVAGDGARLATAFGDVRIASLETAEEWIGAPPTPLRYRQSESHWLNWQRRGATIFR